MQSDASNLSPAKNVSLVKHVPVRGYCCTLLVKHVREGGWESILEPRGVTFVRFERPHVTDNEPFVR